MTPFALSVDLLGGPSKVAALLGATPQAVCFWRDGRRAFPVERCAIIERATAGAVTRRDLRPNDWHLIWPELIDADHPAPVEAAA